MFGLEVWLWERPLGLPLNKFPRIEALGTGEISAVVGSMRRRRRRRRRRTSHQEPPTMYHSPPLVRFDLALVADRRFRFPTC
jgi:hypothetical protein